MYYHKVCIIDYGVGNLTSVKNSLELLGVSATISSSRDSIRKATHLVLPGVGSFGAGILGLRVRNLIPVLREEVVEKRKKILGICLGMQLFASEGFEGGSHKGLDFIKGKVVKIDTRESGHRLPHIGWNNVAIENRHIITSRFESEPIFYFVHSYHFVPDERRVVAGTSCYGHDIVALVEDGNIWGTQFHPEKSDMDGLQIFKNFLDL